MFIIERRTAGVLAALATTAAMVVLSNVGDPADVAETPTAANSTTAVPTPFEPDARPIASATNDVQATREIPETPRFK
jgi:hypothetical protein